MQVIQLPDGYNGHTEPYNTIPVYVGKSIVRLQHAIKPWLTRWCYTDTYLKAIQSIINKK